MLFRNLNKYQSESCRVSIDSLNCYLTVRSNQVLSDSTMMSKLCVLALLALACQVLLVQAKVKIDVELLRNLKSILADVDPLAATYEEDAPQLASLEARSRNLKRTLEKLFRPFHKDVGKFYGSAAAKSCSDSSEEDANAKEALARLLQ